MHAASATQPARSPLSQNGNPTGGSTREPSSQLHQHPHPHPHPQPDQSFRPRFASTTSATPAGGQPPRPSAPSSSSSAFTPVPSSHTPSTSQPSMLPIPAAMSAMAAAAPLPPFKAAPHLTSPPSPTRRNSSPAIFKPPSNQPLAATHPPADAAANAHSHSQPQPQYPAIHYSAHPQQQQQQQHPQQYQQMYNHPQFQQQSAIPYPSEHAYLQPTHPASYPNGSSAPRSASISHPSGSFTTKSRRTSPSSLRHQYNSTDFPHDERPLMHQLPASTVVTAANSDADDDDGDSTNSDDRLAGQKRRRIQSMPHDAQVQPADAGGMFAQPHLPLPQHHHHSQYGGSGGGSGMNRLPYAQTGPTSPVESYVNSYAGTAPGSAAISRSGSPVRRQRSSGNGQATLPSFGHLQHHQQQPMSRAGATGIQPAIPMHLRASMPHIHSIPNQDGLSHLPQQVRRVSADETPTTRMGQLNLAPQSGVATPIPADGAGALRNGSEPGPFSRTPELRQQHMLAERRRRMELKTLFDDLRAAVGETRSSSKHDILHSAVQIINQLREENQLLRTQSATNNHYQNPHQMPAQHNNHYNP